MSEPTEPTVISPALSQEEWAKQRGALTVDACGDIYWGESCFLMRDDPLAIDLFPDESDQGFRHHALAALCLYRQPFGFTAEDVADLLVASGICLKYGQEGVCDSLESLAARIAALLPPSGR